jgi:hypothetical protein
MLRISSGKDERERAVPRPSPEFRETRMLPAKLIHVALAELLESARIVSEPRPQLGARCQLRFPCCNAARSRDTPRGQRRSIRIRYPSERFAGSYTRFSRTSTAGHPTPLRPPFRCLRPSDALERVCEGLQFVADLDQPPRSDLIGGLARSGSFTTSPCSWRISVRRRPKVVVSTPAGTFATRSSASRPVSLSNLSRSERSLTS